MPKVQLFDFEEMWIVIEPLAIPVIIWFFVSILIVIFIASMRQGIVKQIISGLAVVILHASVILFLLVGLGAI